MMDKRGINEILYEIDAQIAIYGQCGFNPTGAHAFLRCRCLLGALIDVGIPDVVLMDYADCCAQFQKVTLSEDPERINDALALKRKVHLRLVEKWQALQKEAKKKEMTSHDPTT